MSEGIINNISNTTIRKIKVVVDLEDPFSPELPLEDFVKIRNMKPKPPRYRIVNIEVVTCPEDHQPVLVTECGRCPKFIRRFQDEIVCRRIIP